jgi:response regulator of citrate/malate metabolism
MRFERGNGGQYEIRDFLKHQDHKLTSREIAKGMDVSIPSIQRIMGKMTDRLVHRMSVKCFGRPPVNVYWMKK